MSSKETMTFYADMTAPAAWNRGRRQTRVKEVLEAVGLGHRHDVLVGGDLPGGLKLRGLSGGEKKRLAVAAGILAGPAVIFLDEVGGAKAVGVEEGREGQDTSSCTLQDPCAVSRDTHYPGVTTHYPMILICMRMHHPAWLTLCLLPVLLLLLLQPTSGLDSFGALSVMGYLQTMAQAHAHTIITTIHQPRSQIFQMFDVSMWGTA
jgi:ABC-type multidrug transport system ATPase subunit